MVSDGKCNDNYYEFLQCKKINCALMFVISNHYGKIVLSSFVQLEYNTDVCKVISDKWHNGI